MMGVLSSEWLKLRSIRSTRIIALVIAAGFAAMPALTWWAVRMSDGMDPVRRQNFGISPLEPLMLSVVELCVAILAVLSVTGEYKTGLIRGTFAAVPKRGRVIAAKAVTVSVIAVVLGTVLPILTRLATDPIVGDRTIRYWHVPMDDVVVRALAMGPVCAAFALLGLGLALLTRSSVASIGTIVGLWYVLPIVSFNLPAPWNERVYSITLTALDGQLSGLGTQSGSGENATAALLSPAGAAVVLVVYAAAALLPGIMAARRRGV